jgi:ubiquitin-conjugating enzyme E2 M
LCYFASSFDILVANPNIISQQPNDEDPLNHDAAAVLRDDPKKFENNVRRAMAGGYIGETHFPRCM